MIKTAECLICNSLEDGSISFSNDDRASLIIDSFIAKGIDNIPIVVKGQDGPGNTLFAASFSPRRPKATILGEIVTFKQTSDLSGIVAYEDECEDETEEIVAIPCLVLDGTFNKNFIFDAPAKFLIEQLYFNGFETIPVVNDKFTQEGDGLSLQKIEKLTVGETFAGFRLVPLEYRPITAFTRVTETLGLVSYSSN